MAGRRGGRIIDKWDLTIQTDDGTKTPVIVPVKMLPGSPTKFSVDVDYQGVNFYKTNENIDRLKEETIAWLKSQTKYEWEEFLYVEFFGATPNIEREWISPKSEGGPEEVQTEVCTALRYSRYRIATNASGQKIHRDLSKVHNRGRIEEGLPEEGFEEDAYLGGEFSSDCSRVLVRYTPEAEAVLKSIVDGFVLLSDRLRNYLRPDGIEARIADAAAVKLLRIESRRTSC